MAERRAGGRWLRIDCSDDRRWVPPGGNAPNRRTTWLMAPERRHGRPGHGRRSATAQNHNPGAATPSTSRSSPRSGFPPPLVAIFVGGALGTVARYLLDAHHPVAPGDFPWVTLLVNLTGSFAIGLLVPLTEHLSHRAPWLRPFLIVGFLGGWTTYSTLGRRRHLLGQGR